MIVKMITTREDYIIKMTVAMCSTLSYNFIKDDVKYNYDEFFNERIKDIPCNGKQVKCWSFLSSKEHYIRYVVDLLKLKRVRKDELIVDAGCGVSPLLLTLIGLGYTNLKGLEYNPKLIEGFESLLYNMNIKREHIKLHQCNLLKFDDIKVNEIYNKAKFIYLYKPIEDDSYYHKLISNITSNMNKGSYIHDPYGPIAMNINKNTNVKYIQNNTLKKIN